MATHLVLYDFFKSEGERHEETYSNIAKVMRIRPTNTELEYNLHQEILGGFEIHNILAI